VVWLLSEHASIDPICGPVSECTICSRMWECGLICVVVSFGLVSAHGDDTVKNI
jgi:hypothetical protein